MPAAIGLARIRLERRGEVGPLRHAVFAGGGILAALLFCGLALALSGTDPWQAFAAMAKGGFGSGRAIAETLTRAAPLMLTGLAAAIAFRARIWNIGAEGQLFAGAILSYGASLWFSWLPDPLLFLAVLAAGALGGALYGGLAGVLKTRCQVDEIISTVMLNYIVLYLLSLLLLDGPWSEPGSFYQQTPKVAEAAALPLLVGKTRFHVGFALALASAAFLYLLLRRTSLGFEIRAFGFNPTALQFKGVDTRRLTVVILMLSGALAGLAGYGEVFGLQHRLRPDISPGFGYSGIIVAILGGLHPLGVAVAAIAFGGLSNGSTLMQITTGIPTALVYAIQAIVLLFFLAGVALGRYRLKRGLDGD